MRSRRRSSGELERRERVYRDDRSVPVLCGRKIILVDDGLATGSTMRAAIAALREQRPAHILVAVPVGAPEICAEFERESNADEIVCLQTPTPFCAVGLWYEDFEQTTDEEVRQLLERAAREFQTARTLCAFLSLIQEIVADYLCQDGHNNGPIVTFYHFAWRRGVTCRSFGQIGTLAIMGKLLAMCLFCGT